MTTMRGQDLRAHASVSGSVELAGEPRDLFWLFTPEGERAWVPGWNPTYPASATAVEKPGTTFVTHNRGVEGIWVITDRDEEACRGQYVCIMPGVRADLVTVRIMPSARGRSEVRVTYALTSLSADHDAGVHEFAETFRQRLDAWREMIEARTT